MQLYIMINLNFPEDFFKSILGVQYDKEFLSLVYQIVLF